VFTLDKQTGTPVEVPALPHLGDVRALQRHLSTLSTYTGPRTVACRELLALLDAAVACAQHELAAHPERCVAADLTLHETYETALRIALRWHLVGAATQAGG
jgi:hypothetical protein